MKHDEFVGEIQHRAHLASRGAAEAAIRATLETLGERIPRGTAEHLAAQLPPEIGHHLRGHLFERFSLQGFYQRVAGREPADEPEAIFHARIVLTLIAEIVSPGVMVKVRRELPESYQPLLLPERGAAVTAMMD